MKNTLQDVKGVEIYMLFDGLLYHKFNIFVIILYVPFYATKTQQNKASMGFVNCNYFYAFGSLCNLV